MTLYLNLTFYVIRTRINSEEKEQRDHPSI